MDPNAPTALDGLPLTRRCPLDPPEELSREHEQRSLVPMTYPDGHQGWLATGNAAARAVLADPRFSVRADLQHSPIAMEVPESVRKQPQPGMFTRLDDPEHARYRRQLTGAFTVRRIKTLEPMIERIAEELLDAMEREHTGQGAVDLVAEYALPLPSLVICELLGVPHGERSGFNEDSRVLLALDTPMERRMQAFGAVARLLARLVSEKRAEPGDDLLSDLITAGDLTDEELVNIGTVLLVAGHETTANQIGLGVYALLQHPDQLRRLQEDEAIAGTAVEEMLRYLSIIHIGPLRTATEDVEVDGQLVRKGQSVTISVPVANRDPERFPDPERLDLGRSATGHLAFGHGVHQCLGQQLARSELRIAFTALFRRFPSLRLAVPADEVRMRSDMAIYGVHELPVSWTR
ncbi:cytochrome P450 [Allokutzneria sp. A3M-2-11 16]|uniref:cytochrome P450 n=1 Tax=Allokutzneria sp. A3M-2-11 16 TaxID=2962043 RepID=UPI0020B78115|nr:cytochrome P450 [Allokutzneria sp. A3M-2-11 16]MCP3797785.1 cytochrome P450 [Allokutzneria sp. A3M-2-11 16]